jgi:hypothetical protein
VIIHFGGGDGLKFGDVIVAVASMVVIFGLVNALLELALVPVNTALSDIAVMVSILVAGLIVGYVFAGNIREESRMKSILKVVVLFALVFSFGFVTYFTSARHHGLYVDEYLNNTYSSHVTWTNENYVAYEMMVLFMYAGVVLVYSLALCFVGLYVGSMRKPSAKTKE